MRVLAELGKVVDIFENQALVQPDNKLVWKELEHVPCDKLSLQSPFLNLPSDFNVIMSPYPVVKNKQPHSHVFEWVNWFAAGIKWVELLNKLVKELSAMPDCLC